MARDLFGLPTATSGAVFTSGASEGTRRAVVAARARLATVDVRRAVVYLTGQTHHSVRQALHDAGIPADCLRVLPTTPDLRIDLAAAEAMIRRDRRWRRRIPWLIVSTFGTTNTGTVDNLAAISDLAARYEMWHHCDAAYGGGFALTKLGQDRMDGIQQADSLVFDQHKGWSHPFGLSTLLVARLTDLQDAYTPRGADYLPPSSVHGLVDNNTLGPEQTRPDRGIEAALPLYAHGTDALTEHLDQMLDLTHIAYHDLTANPLLDLPWVPDLSIVAVRLRDRTDSAQRALLHALNASGRAIVSGTTIRGQIFLRLCLLAHNTGPDDVADILDLIHHHTKDQ
jgi:aromatic-L-amino-acid decarboxylase